MFKICPNQSIIPIAQSNKKMNLQKEKNNMQKKPPKKEKELNLQNADCSSPLCLASTFPGCRVHQHLLMMMVMVGMMMMMMRRRRMGMMMMMMVMMMVMIVTRSGGRIAISSGLLPRQT